MPRPRKSPGQREQARQEAVRQYNVSGKGKARKARYRARRRAERIQVQAPHEGTLLEQIAKMGK